MGDQSLGPLQGSSDAVAQRGQRRVGLQLVDELADLLLAVALQEDLVVALG